MGNRRDEFTTEAKKKLGFRAGFKCCFPGCNKILVGKAENKNGYVFNGEYAHITAASPGGPRYDTSLTEEERKSYDNGILLCRNHASLIDADEKNYPVELLKKWRKIAEDNNYNELLNNKYYEKSEEEIEASLSTLLDDGDYKELDNKINEYKVSISDNKDEIVLRYKILSELIHDYDIKEEIEKYSRLKSQKLQLIINELIIFDKRKYISIFLESLKNDEEKKIYSLVLSNSNLELLSNKDFASYFQKYDEAVKHLQLQVLFKEEYACYFRDKNNNLIQYEDDSFLYELIINTITLKKKIVLLENIGQKELDDAFLFFVKHLQKINSIPSFYRLTSFNILLNYLAIHKTESFLNIYNELTENDKNDINIQNTFYRYKLNTQAASIDELEEFGKKTSNYEFLLFYLFKMPPNNSKQYLDNHLFLLKESSLFLLKYLMCINEDERKDFYSKYKESYSKDDFVSSCLSWLYYDEQDMKETCFSLESDPVKGMTIFNAMIYLHTLVVKKEYVHYFELVKTLKGVDIDILLSAFELQNLLAEDKTYNKELIELYETKIKEGIKFKDLRYYLALIYYYEGNTKKAEELLNKEFDDFKSINSLHSLLAIRIELKDYLKDDRFEAAKHIHEYGCQLYVAETLYQEREYETALIYYERATLCKKDDKAAHVKIFEITNTIKFPRPKEIKEAVAVTIKNKKEEIVVLFHKKEVINGFKNREENHYSVDDGVFSEFYLKQNGDLVTYKSSKYKISNIENTYDYYARKGLLILMNDPETKKFDNSTIEGAINSITEVLQESKKETEKDIENYLTYAKACPISISYKRVFRSHLFANLDFVYSVKNRENINLYIDGVQKKEHSKIYFYYDSLFILFKLFNKKKFKTKDNWYIPNRIYLDLKDECNKELKDIEDNVEKLNIINDAPTRIIQSKEDRMAGRKWIKDFLDFLSSFRIEKGSLYKIGELVEVLKSWEGDMKSECEAFDLMCSNTESCIISDSVFIHFLCSVLKKDYLPTFNLLENYFDIEYTTLLNEIINPIQK